MNLAAIRIVSVAATRSPGGVLALVFEGEDAAVTVGKVDSVAHAMQPRGQVHQPIALLLIHKKEPVVDAEWILIEHNEGADRLGDLRFLGVNPVF